ncbi:MAG: GNAT family N-acetyltransferase [bacterium]|nr:GNAT family N-acetyltransferase [bacterium]
MDIRSSKCSYYFRKAKEYMDTTIENARPSDARGIQTVFYKTWLDTYPNEQYGITRDDVEDRYKEAFTTRLVKRENQIQNLPPNHRFFVARDRGSVTGVCHAIVHNDRNELQAIYVLPEYQGKGIGKMLWERALNFFDPRKDIYVKVAVYNQKAIGFYKRFGFQETGKTFSDERFRMKSGALIPELELVFSRSI